MFGLCRQMTEASCLLGTRMLLGDERAAKLVFSQDYDAGFTGRHTHQLAALFRAECEAAHRRADQ